MKKKAFTLAEMTVVVGVITVLASIIYPLVVNRSQKVTEKATENNLILLRSAVFAFRRDTGLSPVQMSDLWAISAPTNGINSAGTTTALTASRWHGPYIDPQFTNVTNDLLTSGTLTFTASTATSKTKISETQTGNDSDGVAYTTY